MRVSILKSDSEYKSLNEKKVLLIITESLIGGDSTITSSTLSKIILSVGTVISSSAAFLTSVAILIINDYISKSKLRYTKLRDWIIFFNILYEKTLNQPMVDKNINEKEALELKNLYKPNLT